MGLQSAFTSIFPISSHSGNARLEFVSYALGEPPFDVEECQQRGLTFASPLRAKVRLTIMDHEASKPTVKEVKEQEVYMGEIPLMTRNGSFVINGTERVIVSQLHRSPGVFFEHDRGKTHSSGKLLFSARVIPYRGSWLDFEFDPKDYLYFRVDRRRKMPVTILLKALGYNSEQILEQFFAFDTFHITKKGIEFEVVPERLRGEIARSTSSRRPARSSSQKDKRITVKHIREMEAAGMKKLTVEPDFLLGRTLAQNVVNKETGEVVANANDEITEAAAEEDPRGRRRGGQDPLHQRPRPGPVHLADPARRRDHRRAERAGRDLPHDAPRRAADGRRREDALQRPVLHRGPLRPVGRGPHEVQPPRGPRRAHRRR